MEFKAGIEKIAFGSDSTAIKLINLSTGKGLEGGLFANKSQHLTLTSPKKAKFEVDLSTGLILPGTCPELEAKMKDAPTGTRYGGFTAVLTEIPKIRKSKGGGAVAMDDAGF